jgi:hypothetical protein
MNLRDGHLLVRAFGSTCCRPRDITKQSINAAMLVKTKPRRRQPRGNFGDYRWLQSFSLMTLNNCAGPSRAM